VTLDPSKRSGQPRKLEGEHAADGGDTRARSHHVGAWESCAMRSRLLIVDDEPRDADGEEYGIG
jgi:hypothetical protein